MWNHGILWRAIRLELLAAENSNTDPLVSFLVTAYNAEHFIGHSIRSICNQDYNNLEIVVVDDGSNDKTTDILHSIKAEDKRIHVYSPGRIGRAKALNVGLRHCTGQYIAINDADDFSKRERTRIQVNFLEENPTIGLLGSSMEISENGTISMHQVVTNDEQIRRAFTMGQPIQHSTVMVKAQLLTDIGGYNENIPFLLDRDMFLRMAAVTKLHQLNDRLIILNRSANQYFKNRYTGIERSIMSSRYQLKAVDQFHYSKTLKIQIVMKLIWSIILNLGRKFKK